MKYLKELYLSPYVKQNSKRLISSLEKKRPKPYLYVLTIAAHPEDQLDLYPAEIFMQDTEVMDDLIVVGFAAGREDGIDLLMQITQEVVTETGMPDVRKYLLGKERR